MLAAKRLISAASRSAAIRKVPAMLAVPSVKMTTENVPQNPRKSAPLLHSVVVMVSGPDAQDILPLFSSRVTELNGNVEESRMTVLGGDFTVISLLSVPMSTSPAQVATAVSSTFPDFTVAARQTSAVPKQPEPAKVLGLDLEGPDQSGIVKSLADILYKYNVSIKDLVTDTSSAPFIGYNIFALKSIIAVPFKTDFAAFEADLQQFEEKFGLTMQVSDPQEQNEEDVEEDGEGYEGEGEDMPPQGQIPTNARQLPPNPRQN